MTPAGKPTSSPDVRMRVQGYLARRASSTGVSASFTAFAWSHSGWGFSPQPSRTMTATGRLDSFSVNGFLLDSALLSGFLQTLGTKTDQERMPETWDAIVVGAGAAGLLAAARAAELGRRTLLLEKNRKAGVKILMSGGTRCNITHDCDERGIVAAFGRNGPFLHSALAALGPRDIITLFHDEGVVTKVEPGGKV